MADIAAIISAAGTVGTLLQNGFNTGYGIYQDQRNYETQKEQFNTLLAYDKETRDLMMEREDNAIQRRVADLVAAGIHPALAVQGMGAAQAQQGHAPSNSSVGSMSVPQLNALSMQQARLLDLAGQQTLADIEKTQAEAQEIRDRTNRENQYLGIEKDRFNYQASIAALDASLLQEDLRRRPEEYANLLLHNSALKAQTSYVKEQTILAHQQVLMDQFRRDKAFLDNEASRLGIAEQTLENLILFHDADRVIKNPQRSDVKSFFDPRGWIDGFNGLLEKQAPARKSQSLDGFSSRSSSTGKSLEDASFNAWLIKLYSRLGGH